MPDEVAVEDPKPWDIKWGNDTSPWEMDWGKQQSGPPAFQGSTPPEVSPEDKAIAFSNWYEPPPEFTKSVLGEDQAMPPDLSPTSADVPSLAPVPADDSKPSKAMVPIESAGKLAGGVIDWATSPKGMIEQALALTPAAPAVLLKWGTDMIKSGKESIDSIGDRITELLRSAISDKYITANKIGAPPELTPEKQDEYIQGFSDDIVNLLGAGAGAYGALHGAVKSGAALLPKSSQSAALSAMGDLQRIADQIPKEPNALDTEAAQPVRALRDESIQSQQQVPPEGAGPKDDGRGNQGEPTPGAGIVPPEAEQARVPLEKPSAEMSPAEVLAKATAEQDPMSVVKQHYADIMQAYRERKPINMEAARKYEPDVEGVKDLGEWLYQRGYRANQSTGNWIYFGKEAMTKAAKDFPLESQTAPPPEGARSEVQQTAPTPGESPKGIAASVRNKWTSATESPLGSEAGFINLAPLQELWDKYSPSVKAAINHVKETAAEQMNLPKTSDYRRSVLNWSGKMQRSWGEAAAAQKEIESVVKDPAKRDGITNWMQAGGDPSVLQDRLNKTIAWRDPVTGKPHPQAKKLIAGYEAALKLTPAEVRVAMDARNAYDTLGRRGQAHDVLKSFKDNYVTQIWDLNKGPTGGGGGRTLKDRFRFSKASTFPTFFDGEQAGFVPKTKDISKILPVYLHEMNSVIASRQLVEQMSKGKASDGRPLLAAKGTGIAVDSPKGKATLVLPDAMKEDFSDYKTIANQPALHDWRWQTKDAAGNPVFMKADLALHPEAYDKLKNVLGKSAIKEWYQSKGSMAASIPKALVKGLDLFQSETKKTMLGVLTPFHQVQEGTHAVGHRVNPFFNNPKIDLVNNRAQMDAANHGLMLLPDRASADQFMEGFKQSKLVSAIPGIGPLADHYSNYLFHEYIPGIKFKTYEAILDRNSKVYAKDITAGKATIEDVKALSASQTNAAYGHLNYADLARNPTVQHFIQLVALAPDFLEARGRFAVQALKGVGGAKVGREQVIALATLAVAQAAGSYIASKLTGGQWDYKDPFSFHVGNRKYTMRSVPEDMVRFMADTRAFTYARLNPITGVGPLQLATGTDWRGNKVTAGQTLKQLAQQPIPLIARPLAGTANTPLTGLEQLAGDIGLKISRYSAQSEVRKLAHQWMANSTNPKLRAEEERFQKESFGDSDYKPLREALINNDTKAFKEAYQKLLETKDASLIARTMNNPKPLSGAAARETAFRNSLTPDQKILYEQAKKEQAELRLKFNLYPKK
jgi:hypothetical protein